jgi:hypothetical protein
MPTPTYTPLATVTLGASASSVTFSSIPATYRDLRVVINSSNTTGATYAVFFRLNSDTGSNYSDVRAIGDGSTAFSNGFTLTNGLLGWSSSGTLAATTGDFMDYSATDKHKTVLARGNDSSGRVSMSALRWANTAAVTTLQLLSESPSSFTSGSTFSLFGIAS